MSRRLSAALALGSLAFATAASAKPVAPVAFCAHYPDAPACASGVALCVTCHTAPPGRNTYGLQIEQSMLVGTPRPLDDEQFLAGLADALVAVEDKDADGDGFDNLEEVLGGTSPADALSRPIEGDCPRSVAENGWDVCNYDHTYVFKKLHLDFCGHSPSRDDVDLFEASEDRLAALHEALDGCLDTEFWRGRDGVVWNLANRKIGPLQSIKSGEGAGDIPLADYFDDYAFFVWTQTDDRDVRDVLTGNYFVRHTGGIDGEPTVYETFESVGLAAINDRQERLTVQLVNRGNRAGMLTHRWFLMSNIMFTGLPRTAAAQAYRAYLGHDIARLEGLVPVANEPADHDAKGVAAPECARCHSTLDPLTYPFSRYEGIQGGSGNFRIPFTYNRNRMDAFVETDGPGMADVPEAGVLFGQPVDNLVQWARVAAETDDFARATTLDYWRLLMGEDPRTEELPDFDGLWQGLKTTHEYRIERLLHALIETEAYGVP